MLLFPRLSLVYCALLFTIGVFAQKTSPTLLLKPAFLCADNPTRDHLLKQYPEREKAQNEFEDQLYHLFSKGNMGQPDGISALYTIPVVVHIIHNGGAENISDARVLDAIKNLNDAFAHSGYFAQTGPGTDANIRFCLARRTPDGLFTSGINRIVSPLTNMTMETQDLFLKNLIRWDPKRYVNIWVVNSIASISLGPGVAGYAYFPSSHGKPEDGIVCLAELFGKSPKEDVVLTHEMGHYLGLYHTFEGGCPNTDCQKNGDRVCDTPPDQAQHTACENNSCDTDTDAPAPNPFSADVADPTENFMDYSPFECYFNFTPGQIARMEKAITLIRNSLLDSDACSDPCPVPITAAFTIDPPTGIAGATSTFTNLSTGAATYQWLVNGVPFSTDVNPAYTFNYAGAFTITLVATSADSNCAVSKITLPYQVECPINITVTISTDNIKVGETVTFSSITSGADSLKWYINGVEVGNTPALSYNFPTSGTYTIGLFAKNAFCEATYTQNVTALLPCQEQSKRLFAYSSPVSTYFTHLQHISQTPGKTLVTLGTQIDPALPDPNGIKYRGIYAKMTPQGEVLWAKKMNERLYYALETMPDNGLLMTGRFLSTGSGINVSALARTDAAGTILWSKQMQYDNINIAPAPDGNIYCTAYENKFSILSLDGTDGSLRWTKQLPFNGPIYFAPYALKTASNGDGLLFAQKIQSLVRKNVMLRIDPLGNLRWSREYHNFPGDEKSGSNATLLTPHADGGFTFSNKYQPQNLINPDTVCLIRCDAGGIPLWANTYVVRPQATRRFIGWIKATSDEGILFLLYEQSGTTQYYTLIRTDSQGNPRWATDISNIGLPSLTGGCTLGPEEDLILGLQSKLTAILRFDSAGIAGACLKAPIVVTRQPVPVTSTLFTPSWTTSIYALRDYPLTAEPITLLRSDFCSTLPPCPEICDNGFDDDEDGYLDCYDADCPCFTASSCSAPPGTPATGSISVKQSWQSSGGQLSPEVTPYVGNLNPQTDTIPEVLTLGIIQNSVDHIKIFKGDGSNAANPDRLPLPKKMLLYNSSGMAIGDLDRDGSPELVLVELDSFVRIYRNYVPGANPAMQLWLSSDLRAASFFSKPQLADFDQDGKPEIYLGNEIFQLDYSNPANPKLKKVLSGNGPFGQFSTYYLFSKSSAPIAVDILTPADCNGDPDCNGLELVAGPVIYAVDLDPLDEDGVEIKIVRDLNLLQPAYNWKDGYTAVADMDLNGIPDIIVNAGRQTSPTATQTGIYIWNKNGAAQFLPDPPPGNSGVSFCSGYLCISNVYDDRKHGFAKDFPEIIVASRYALNCLNLQAAGLNPAQPWWWTVSTSDDSGGTGSTAFDLNNDGSEEIVFRDETHLRILYGGNAPFPPGVDAQRNWWQTPSNSGTVDEYPVIADVDADGAAEIVMTGPNPAAGFQNHLRVFESAGAPWAGCRQIWNQPNYNPVAISDDLSIPAQQQKSWLEFPGPGGGKFPLNKHRCQIPLLKDFEPYHPAADAVITLDSFFCQNQNLHLQLTVCNQGSAVMPAGTPLQLYAGNPTVLAAAKIGAPFLLPADVAAGKCLKWPLQMPVPPDGTLWGVVNDNGTLAVPFDPGVDFPSTSLSECNYTNNSFTLNISFSNPILDLGADRTLCQSSVALLSAGDDFIQYRWQDGSTDSTFTAPGPGKYWVDAWDLCGNKQSDTLTIALQNTVAFELGPDRGLCAGDSLTLQAPANVAVTWSSTTTIPCMDCPSITLYPTAPFTVHGTIQIGNCFVSDSIRLNIQPNPVPTWQVTPSACGAGNGTISAGASGGSAPFTYAWSNGKLAPNIDSLSADFYTLLVTNAEGCSATAVVEVPGADAPVLNDTLLTDIRCFGEKNGAIALDMAGGNPTYTYTWSGGFSESSVSNLAAGTHTVTVTGPGGCTLVRTFLITEPPELLLSAAVMPSICADDTASILLTPKGGTGPYSVSWNDSDSNFFRNNLPPGDYTAQVADANGCTVSQSFHLEPGDSPVLAGSNLVPIRCFGESNGQITTTISGGTPPYLYDWSGGGNTNTLTNLAAGVYTLTVKDANDCLLQHTFNLTEPALFTVPAVVNSTSCTNTTGSITLSPEGGVLPYAVNWNDSNSAWSRTGLPPGVYTATATDANGCSTTQTFTLDPGGAPVLADSNLVPIRCFGEANGQITTTISGGTPPYQYDWSGGGNTNTLTNLAAGNYILTVKDAKDCLLQHTFNLAEPALFTVPAVVDSTSCTSATGSITLSPEGGVLPYAVNWNDSNSAWSRTGLPPGVYTATATDANGCSITQTFTLDPGGAPVLADSNLIPIRCFGESNGQITTTISSGTPPYLYDWSGGGNTNTLANLAAGMYTLTVKDANGCLLQHIFNLMEPALFTVPAVVDSTSCTSATGSITLSPVGGVLPYAVNWNDSNSAWSRTGLPPGVYTATATDANGCSITQTFTLDPGGAPLLADSNLVPIRCFGESNGQISTTISGGTPPYLYNWSGGGNTNALANLAAGMYTLTVKDANDCLLQHTFILAEPALFTVPAVVDSTSCTSATGSITLFPEGGILPYAVNWNDSNSAWSRTGLPPGIYTATATDANGCSITQTFTLDPGGAPVLADSNLVPIRCFGEANGQITTTVSGGTPPYQYDWSGGGNTNALANLAAGVYTLTVTDAKGCILKTQFNLPQAPAIDVQTSVQADTCFKQTGAVLVDIMGGALPYQFQWFGGQTSEDLNQLIAGDWALTLTDAHGCTVVTAGTVAAINPAIENVAFTVDSVSCFGWNDGRIRVDSVSGGYSPFEYSFGNGPFSAATQIDSLFAGSYTLTVVNAAGCIWQQNIPVAEPGPLNVTLTASDTLVTVGQSVQLQAIVIPPDAILTAIEWWPMALFSVPQNLVQQIIPEETTLFQIRVHDANGCTAISETRVIVKPAQDIYLPNVFNPASVHNSGFTVFAGSEIKQVRLLRIFDRWGELIFERADFPPNDPDLGWHGEFRGKQVASGVFTFHLIVELQDGGTIERTGDVTLLR